LGELSKVVLIVFGVAPCIVRDLALAVGKLPTEQLVKAQSLGASTWQIALRVVLPQIMPRLIESVRLMLGPAFLFDLGRGDRRRCRARLSHLPDAALSRHGCDPALRCLDHAARLSDGFRARLDRAPQLSLGLCAGRAAMSALSVRDVWVEYGDQIVLER